ncbi:MAG: nickel-dependent lactate racemase [Deltaproteobacteria bacterium]|nr:nickel-dependent lactate racemase [Deltaproteobacteria bacterium]
MDIQLAFGKSGLTFSMPDDLDVTVLEPQFVPGVKDPEAALRKALKEPIGSKPLQDLLSPEARVGVIFSDITRPAPNHLIVPAVLEVLSHVPGENITLFNALGTHRENTDDELRGMLGDGVVDEYRIVQNDAFDNATQVQLGTTGRGHDVWMNRELMSCDVKILTGFIEPHFFAGFSGGGKAVMPGMAGMMTVLGNHDAGMIGDPKTNWGITRGNPVWEEIQEVCSKVDPTFLFNVTLNKDKEITGVFAGDLEKAHAAGCEFVRKSAMVPVPEPFDVVITSNSGYPLDLNLYQAVKGMSAAAQVVKQGGSIIIVAECWDGIPDHGMYKQLLSEADNPQGLLDRVCTPGFLEHDQWEAQIQALIQLKADVYVHSTHLSVKQIEEALLKPCPSIETTLDEILQKEGRQARICVLPEGPQTIPYIEK